MSSITKYSRTFLCLGGLFSSVLLASSGCSRGVRTTPDRGYLGMLLEQKQNMERALIAAGLPLCKDVVNSIETDRNCMRFYISEIPILIEQKRAEYTKTMTDVDSDQDGRKFASLMLQKLNIAAPMAPELASWYAHRRSGPGGRRIVELEPSEVEDNDSIVQLSSGLSSSDESDSGQSS